MRVPITYNSSANLLNTTTASAAAAIGVSTVPSCQGASCDPSSVLLVQDSPNAPNQPAHIASFILGKFVQAAAALGVVTAIFAARGRSVIKSVLSEEVKGINPSSRSIEKFEGALKGQGDRASTEGLLNVTFANSLHEQGKPRRSLVVVAKDGKPIIQELDGKRNFFSIFQNRYGASTLHPEAELNIDPKDRKITYFRINKNSEVSLPPFAWLDAFTPQQFRQGLIGLRSLFTGNHKDLVFKQTPLAKEAQAA